jgi:ATP-dependent helicase/DNAse subunit B
MNRLLSELADFCESYPLEEKILVVPSLLIGNQMTEALVRAGHSWVNIRVNTIQSLALSLVGAELAKDELSLISQAHSMAFIEEACLKILNDKSYFGKLRGQDGLHRAIYDVIRSLGETGIGVEDFSVKIYEDPKKGKELKEIITFYYTLLKNNNFTDESITLKQALKLANKDTHAKAYYLYPEDLNLSEYQKKLLEKLSNNKSRSLKIDSSELGSPPNTSTNIFKALGVENELREIFRRIISHEIPLDDTEILFTDSETCPALIYELSEQYNLPCTFSEGISVTFTRPGQAVIGYLDWISQNFESRILRQVISAGNINLRAFSIGKEPPSPISASRILRKAQIGWHRERYIPCLENLIKCLTEKTKEASKEIDKEDSKSRVEKIKKQINGAETIKSAIIKILEITPDFDEAGHITLKELATGAGNFIEIFARTRGLLDQLAFKTLIQLFEDLSNLPETKLTPLEAHQRLRSAVMRSHVDSSTPKPGKLHVGHYKYAGISGRKNTFIMGLDETKFPGSGIQNPVLLDAEREKINTELQEPVVPLLGERPKENVKTLWNRFFGLEGCVTLSYSCLDLLEDKEQFPAPFVLSVYRMIYEKPSADYSQMSLALGEPYGFIPNNDGHLDETEWWLKHLLDPSLQNHSSISKVHKEYPWLNEGSNALIHRQKPIFSEFDGRVNSDKNEFDPRYSSQPMSSSRIETLAKCPYSYFLKHVLHVEPPVDIEFDPLAWLDPMLLGCLIHDIFNVFMKNISENKIKPNFKENWDLIQNIANDEIQSIKNIIPPPNETAFKSQLKDILTACEIFLKDEEVHCQNRTPSYFEIPFGLPLVSGEGEISSPDSVKIKLNKGLHFYLRGRIDRVDKHSDGNFSIWDYKTGSTYGMKEDSFFNQGRQVQYALYAQAFNEILKENGMSGRVLESGYFYPGVKGQGKRINLELNEEGLKNVLDCLFDALKEGAFLHSTDKDLCKYCDYQNICGEAESVSHQANLKLEEPENGTILEPYRQLKDL